MNKRLSEKQKKNGAGGETRTRKGLPPVDFEPVEDSASGKGLVIDFKSATGAGDAMVASIALSLDRGESKEVLIKKALATSAGACMSYGTTPADLKTVQELEKQVKIIELK